MVDIKSKISKRVAQGYGQGELESYIPWIKVSQTSSNGKRHRISGIKTQRVHHFLSNNEEKMFNILDFSEQVLDIREQYPLLDSESPSINNTLTIAERLGIRHPEYKGEPVVMTSDFYIKLKSGKVIIRTVKPINALSKRTLEKFEIERIYWEQKNIDWGIITDNELSNKVINKNLSDLRKSYQVIIQMDLNDRQLALFYHSFFCELKKKETHTLGSLSSCLDEKHDKEKGTFLRILKYFIATRAFKTDFFQEIGSRTVLKGLIININEDTILHKPGVAAQGKES